MKIGIVSPLYESCPPKTYGGTERVVTCLCNGLVELGYDVTLFASGDSNTKATLYPITDQSLRLAKPNVIDPYPYITKQLDIIAAMADDFDIMHNNVGFRAFPFAKYTNTPWVTTMHGRLDLLDEQKVYEHFIDTPLVSISQAQRLPLPNNNWVDNVYHGLDIQSFTAVEQPGQYLAFLGRIAEDKGILRAIEIAKQSGVPLKIAAKVDAHDRDFYETEVKHLIDGKHIEYIGEITEAEKSEFLGNALALMFPIQWPEPFGLVVIESYACGTPVITRPFGSMPEIVAAGKTGFIEMETAALVQAVDKVAGLDRQFIRRYAETHFSQQQMAKNYLKVFEQLVVPSQSAIAAVS